MKTTTIHNFNIFDDTSLLNKFAGTLIKFDDDHHLFQYNTEFIESCSGEISKVIKHDTIPSYLLPNGKRTSIDKGSTGMFLGAEDFVVKNELLTPRSNFIMFMVLKFLIEGGQVVSWFVMDLDINNQIISLYKENPQTFDYKSASCNLSWTLEHKKHISYSRQQEENSKKIIFDLDSFFRYLDYLGFIIINPV